jgi:hypothetical protein
MLSESPRCPLRAPVRSARSLPEGRRLALREPERMRDQACGRACIQASREAVRLQAQVRNERKRRSGGIYCHIPWRLRNSSRTDGVKRCGCRRSFGSKETRSASGVRGRESFSRRGSGSPGRKGTGGAGRACPRTSKHRRRFRADRPVLISIVDLPPRYEYLRLRDQAHAAGSSTTSGAKP